ncbi:MAG TPA: hypothetical protein VG675_02360 [Bryobacteraceae bacterium]|nr:hypothetical protein [Bryobacteraceae bacterium]
MFKSLSLVLILSALPATLPAQRNQGGRPVHNEAERLARWKSVEMPFHTQGLSARERQMVEKLVDASRLLNDIYWRQSDYGGLVLSEKTQNADLKSLFSIMGGRWDILDDLSFVGEDYITPGRDLYPHDLTRASLEAYLKQHPEDRAAIYNPYTVVKWQNGRLIGVPYHEEYKRFLEPMAKDLRDAAALSNDPAFAKFLRLRADALLTDNYYESDLAWLDLKDPKIDVIFAPYETYLDRLLSVKTSYGAAVLIRNDEESRKLALYQRYVPEIQEALPIDAADRPSKRGHLTPMEVMDAPYRGGDLRYGYQAVADNLPNDPRIHQEKGTKKIFFKNFMDARVNNVVLPLAKKLMEPAQAAKATGDGLMAWTVLHEISHGLGPAFARQNGKQVDINEAIGPAYGGLEEAKADVTGMFGIKWLVDHNALPKDRLDEFYSSYVAGIFRTLRYGTGEAHGRAMMMEFNYLAENHALTHSGGRYTIDYAQMPTALEQLTKELLEIEATGDRARADAWFTKYDRMPADLKAALDNTTDIPVDIAPVFSFPDNAE